MIVVQHDFETVSQRSIDLHPYHLTRAVIRKRYLVPFSSFRTDRDKRGRLLDAQEDHLGNLHADIEPERAMHAKLVVCKHHLHACRLLLHDALPIVDVHRPLRLAVCPRSDDKLKVRRAQCRRRLRPRHPKRKYRTPADVQRDRRRVDVRERDLLSSALDRRERREVIKLVLRQVDRYRRRVLLCYGRDEDRVAKEVLQVDAKRRRICRILEPERMENRRSIQTRFVEGRIEVIKQAVPVDCFKMEASFS